MHRRCFVVQFSQWNDNNNQWLDDKSKRKSHFGILNSSYLYVFSVVTITEGYSKQAKFFTAK